MELNGAKILFDGSKLEELHIRGIKHYSISLINAYNKLGVDISVLVSKYPLKTIINTDASTIFQKKSFWNSLKFSSPLLLKAIFGISGSADLIHILKDMNLPEDFAFLNDANIYLSPECYRIAKKLRLLGLKLTIAPKPKVDIWHTAYWTPIKIKGAIRVSTIHDIIFLNNPIIKKSFKNSRFYKNIFAQRVRDTIHDSNMVLCDSEQTKKELIYLLDVNPDKLFVNYPPVVFKDNVIPQDTLLNRLMSFDLKYGQYILFIGTALHKNLKRLVEAYLSLSIDIPLVIIGKPKSAYIFVELNKAIFDKRIRILDYVSEADKYVLYKGAMFLAFPSLYEGCGYPPIEAMSVGVPVLTSSVSCMPEVSGDAALYVDPYDVKDIVNKITMMINDKELRQRFIEAGYERAKFFSMDNFKKGLKTAYSKL